MSFTDNCADKCWQTRATAVFVAVVSCACSVPLVNDLEERSAAEVTSALIRHGVPAETSPDEHHDGRFEVGVSRADTSYAHAVMDREQLPRSPRLGVAASLASSSFIANREEQHARWLLGTAGELETTLLSVGQIVGARIHLSAPRQTPLEKGTSAEHNKSTASVLLKHIGSTSPLTTTEIQQLISGAVPGLEPSNVTVVAQSLPPLPPRSGSEWVQLGPLTTTRNSLPYLRWLLIAAAILNGCMGVLLLTVWRRSRLGTASPKTQPASTVGATSDPTSG